MGTQSNPYLTRARWAFRLFPGSWAAPSHREGCFSHVQLRRGSVLIYISRVERTIGAIIYMSPVQSDGRLSVWSTVVKDISRVWNVKFEQITCKHSERRRARSPLLKRSWSLFVYWLLNQCKTAQLCFRCWRKQYRDRSTSGRTV